MQDNIVKFFRGIATIFLYFFLAALGTSLFYDYYDSPNIIISSLARLAPNLLILLVLGIIYHQRLINDFKNFHKEYLKTALKYWLIGLGLMIISNLIITSFLHDISANENINRELLSIYPISSVLSMAIIGPIIEEITFRASFKDAFSSSLSFCLTTALLFGLVHIAKLDLLEFLFVIPYGALGFFFAKAFYQTDNIYTSIFMHMLHNSLSIILIIL